MAGVVTVSDAGPATKKEKGIAPAEAGESLWKQSQHIAEAPFQGDGDEALR